MQRSVSLHPHAQIPPDRPAPLPQGSHSTNNVSSAQTSASLLTDPSTALSDVTSIFEQERLRQMLAQLQAYNGFVRQQSMNQAPVEQTFSPLQAFSQEQFALNPFNTYIPEYPASAGPGYGGSDESPVPQPLSITGVNPNGHSVSSKLSVNPPNLQSWRRKLFDIDELLVLSKDQ